VEKPPVLPLWPKLKLEASFFSSSMDGGSIPVVFQNLAFLAARKSPRIKDRKWVNISNMNPFAIFDPRGFGALGMPTFESRPVYYVMFNK